MKQFKNLNEAFNYQASCPVCDDPIEPDYKEKIVNSSWDRPKIVTIFTLQGGDEVSIDYYTNEILTYTEAKSYKTTYGNPTMTVHTGNYNVYKSGQLIFGVNASCGKCGTYGYSLQVIIDWESKLAAGIFLNAETISIEEGDTLHEIRNAYAVGKTEYDKFTKVDVDDGTVKMSGYSGRQNSTIYFPLMPLDVKNPQLLLKRIKNLIIFS